jgi:anaerobic selenocysteine-containing dehydrogenase
MVTRQEFFTDCTLCYHSCGTRVTVENGKAVKIKGLESHPLNAGRLCPKGANALDVVYSPKRLKQPLKRLKGEWVPIAWEQALDEIAEKLNRLKAQCGPQALAFFCGSIGVENLEMATLVHLLRSGLGSPNFFLGGKHPLSDANSHATDDFRTLSHPGRPRQALYPLGP